MNLSKHHKSLHFRGCSRVRNVPHLAVTTHLSPRELKLSQPWCSLFSCRDYCFACATPTHLTVSAEDVPSSANQPGASDGKVGPPTVPPSSLQLHQGLDRARKVACTEAISWQIMYAHVLRCGDGVFQGKCITGELERHEERENGNDLPAKYCSGLLQHSLIPLWVRSQLL